MNIIQKIIKNIFNLENNTQDIVTSKKYSNRTLPVLLKDHKILLIGGGKVALQKAKVLKANNIEFDIISMTINDDIKSLGVKIIEKRFEEKDARQFNIIIDATGNKEVSDILAEIKKKRFLLINIVDIPEECNFYFSSLLIYNNLKIAVSSDGASPTLTQAVRDKIKEIIPEQISELAGKKLKERNNNIVNIEETKKEIKEIFGKVYIVGCGPGSAEYLTIKALRIIREADVILHDFLVTEEILSFAKEGGEIFCVGKEKGHHLFSQDDINKVMLQFAKAGYKVARLKGGDPFIFGRGGEEAEYLINNNIAVEIVPGITSAFSAPLLAGIPPTHRDYSSGISVITGCGKYGKKDFDWIDLLKKEDHTTIVLMGLKCAEEILQEGLSRGVRHDLPLAIISNASKYNQRVFTSTFSQLLKISDNAERPAVLVFGNVVKLHEKLYPAFADKTAVKF